jgi:hypothetical protein
VGTGCAEVATAGCFDQFGDPGLGEDKRLAPFFAIDDRCLGTAFAAATRGLDGGLHRSDEGFGFGLCVDDGGDEANVFVDVGEGVGGEGEDGEAGLEDCSEGFEAVGDAGDNEVGMSGEDFAGVGSPTVVENVGILGGKPWESFDAVASAGAEMIEPVERVKGDGDGGLEGGYSHQNSSIASYSRLYEAGLVDCRQQLIARGGIRAAAPHHRQHHVHLQRPQGSAR